MLFARLLQRTIKTGRLTVIDATGRTHGFGPPGGQPSATIRLHDKLLHTKLFLRPELCIGEAYMDGMLTIENRTVCDFAKFMNINGRAVCRCRQAN